MESSRILRREALLELVSLSYSTIYRMEARNEFPARRQLAPNSVGWIRTEVEAWLQARSLRRDAVHAQCTMAPAERAA